MIWRRRESRWCCWIAYRLYWILCFSPCVHVDLRSRSPRRELVVLVSPILAIATGIGGGHSRRGVDLPYRNHSSDFSRQILNDIASELPFLSFILYDQPFSVILVDVGTAHLADLIDDEEKNFFGASIALETISGGIADVAPRDVGRPIGREGDTIGHLFAPP